jgi:prepilin-type N-terminal cleavage/methylation domain-containing protein
MTLSRSGTRPGTRTRGLSRVRPTARAGFSLIEVIVAMTMLSVVMLSMGSMVTKIAVRGRGNDVVAKRNSTLVLEANKFGSMPFATLKTFPTTNVTVTRGNFTYTRRLTVFMVANNRYGVKIVVVPASDATKKDSVMFERTLPPAGSPLCLGC